MPQARYKPLRVTQEIIARRAAQRDIFASTFYRDDVELAGGAVLYVTKERPSCPKLYQESPKEKSTFKLPNGQKHRCPTNSCESFGNAADKMDAILTMNNRLPTKEIVLHLLQVLTAAEIRKLRIKIFRYLKTHGLIAVVSIELTYGANGRANNTVHFHILTDDMRSEAELKKLLEKVCERNGLVRNQDFLVRCRKIPKPETYFAYFTKRNRINKEKCEEKGLKRVLLFQPGTGLRKFYVIGQWFRKPKSELWKEFIEKIYGKEGKND
jgi:hypothetical protein